MSDILETARTVEKFRSLLNASRASPGDLGFDLLLRAFLTERERLMAQPISNALDGLILTHAAREAAAALIGNAEKLEPEGVRVLAGELVSALDNLETYLQAEAGMTFHGLNLDASKILH